MQFTRDDLRDHPDILEQHVDKTQIPCGKSRICHYFNLDSATIENSILPRTYVVPYPSDVVWDGTALRPWAMPRSRDILVSYVGSQWHGDVNVCATIGKQCGLWADPDVSELSRKIPTKDVFFCSQYHRGLNREAQNPMEILFRPTLCLQPIGDGIGRKSLSVSYSSCCIPVFFGPVPTYQHREYWLGWHTAAFSVVNRQDFISGRVDLAQALRSVPSGKVKEIQRNIARHGSTFQWSMGDHLQVPDGMDVLPRRLWVDALNLTMARRTPSRGDNYSYYHHYHSTSTTRSDNIRGHELQSPDDFLRRPARADEHWSLHVPRLQG